MDQALVGFVRALRAAGADASPAETLDAARALALVGYRDREALRLTLATTLAKSEAEKRLHDQVFDQYFAAIALPPREGRAESASGDGAPGDERGPQDPAERTGDEGSTRDAAPDGDGDPADADPSASAEATGAPRQGARGGPSAGGRQAPPPQQPDAAGLERLLALAEAVQAPRGSPDEVRAAMQLARAASAAGVDDIRFASQVGYLTGRLMEQLPIEPLDAALRELLLKPAAEQQPGDAARLAGLQQARQQLQRAARDWVQQRFELYGRGATEAFMNQVVVERPIGRMSPPDMERMKHAVARMARRLAVRHSRRRRMRVQGQLDFRRTFRANAGHDSVPVELVFKTRRRDKPKIVVVCDVSGSVATHVRFLLLFLYALHETVGDLRSFAFSDRLKEVSPVMDQLPFDDAMALILKELGSGSTDYGQALADLHEHHLDDIDRQTTVIVLGDGRSNYANPRLDLLAELAERAKRLIWLCPEPAGRWGSGDSCMLQYRPFCTQVRHCANALDLERAIDDTLAAYT